MTLSVSLLFFFFSSRRRHTRWPRDWSSDVCFFRSLFDPMYEFYLENPTITKGELRKILDENDFNPAGMSRIAIRFHMEDPNVEPDEEIYDEVYAEVEALDGVPGGEYYFMLNDNNMDQSGAIGEKDNTIDKTLRSGIMKK